MHPVFDPELLKRAIASPEEIELAKKMGEPFQFEDEFERVIIKGYSFNGIAFITEFIESNVLDPEYTTQNNQLNSVEQGTKGAIDSKVLPFCFNCLKRHSAGQPCR